MDTALSLSGDIGCYYWNAELHRLRGEALLAGRPKDFRAPEDCFLRALEVAKRQHARSLELRAEISLAQLRRRQHRSADAAERLANCYRGFTEGHGTPDLRSAKNLLVELSEETPA